MRSNFLVAGAGVLASVSRQTAAEFVNPEALINDVALENLLKGSGKLQEFADLNGGNRAFGGGGHNA
jgi:hypothetical protein